MVNEESNEHCFGADAVATTELDVGTLCLLTDPDRVEFYHEFTDNIYVYGGKDVESTPLEDFKKKIERTLGQISNYDDRPPNRIEMALSKIGFKKAN